MSGELDLLELSLHIATAHDGPPRWHWPSGECEQYGRHLHVSDFVVWERADSAEDKAEV